MAGYTAQPILGAPRFLTPHELPASPQDVLDAWVAERRPSVELRVALHAKSDFGFVEAMVAQLSTAMADVGLSPDTARAAVAEALSNPSLAVSAGQSGVTRVAQSVILQRDESVGLPYEVLVGVNVQIRQRHVPAGVNSAVAPAVIGHDVACVLIDLESDAQVGELMRHYVRILRSIAPQRSRRTHQYTVLVLGDPADLGTSSLPERWREEVEWLADAFDAKVIFEKGPKIPEGVPNRLMRLFVLDPWAGKLPADRDGNEVPHVAVDGRNNSFDEVFHEFAVHLRSFRPEAPADPFAPRELAPGERVFHRKVGDSGGGYDNFNDGSPAPCSHGKAFKRYTKAIQATKGFERRYTNFDPSWLYHCSESGCGMYAVFTPDKGV